MTKRIESPAIAVVIVVTFGMVFLVLILEGIEVVQRMLVLEGQNAQKALQSPLSDLAGKPTLDTVDAPVEAYRWLLSLHGIVQGIRERETRGGRDLRKGDGGLAAGQLQQHEAHWQRGTAWLGVDWNWPADTYSYEKARSVAIANWFLDCPEFLAPLNPAELIRRFRLPNDPYRADNDEYVESILRIIESRAGPQLTRRDVANRREYGKKRRGRSTLKPRGSRKQDNRHIRSRARRSRARRKG